MPRDGSGNYTLPAGNPVVPNTVIEADWANPTMSDLGAALTDSLSRTGQGGMLVPFLNADGSVAAPGMSWANEQTSGWYRKAPNEFWYSVAGADVFAITAAGITLAPGKIAEGISSFILVQDAEPSPMLQGEQWYESDSGLLAMRYVNPDLTETLVSLGPAGGDFVPYGEKGAADGVAELDSSGQVPLSQLGNISLLTAFPVGAVYITAGNTNPGTFIGGTWSQIAAGRVLLGVGTLGANTYVAGEEGGAAGVALTEAENGIHSHGVTDPQHTHAGSIGTGAAAFPGFISAGSSGGANNATQGTYTMSPNPTGVTLQNSGTGASHENRQPYLAVYYWQRTA